MRYFVASDIHGSYYYAKQMIEAFEAEKADKMLLLGDILYHGPRNDLPEGYEPKKVIELLNGYSDRILCVRGNCDAEVDQMVLTFPIMADYSIIDIGKMPIFATHGHIYNESNPPKMSGKYVLLHGHTHVPVCMENENHIYMNPGSVSIPKENSHHGYMIIENDNFVWKDMSGKIIMEKNVEN